MSILLGRLAGAAVLGGFQALVFVGVFLAFGARVAGGPAAVVVLVVLGVLLAVAVGAWASAIGLRTGSQEAVQNSFPLVFILLFISSAFFPTQLMEGWYRAVAEGNPLTWLIDAARSLVIEGFSPAAAGRAVALALAFGVLTVNMALGQLRRRLAVAS